MRKVISDPDGLYCQCGHLRSQHNEIGCTVDVLTDNIVDLDCNTICRCVRCYRMDGSEDGFVGDHDNEEASNA